MSFRPVQYRPASGRIIAGLTTATCAVAMVILFTQFHLEFAIRSAGFIAFIAAISIAVFWMPKIEVTLDEVEFRNVFTTSRVSWPAIRSIETRWALALVTDHGKATAWASPPSQKPVAGDWLLRGFSSVMPKPTGSVGGPGTPPPRDNVTQIIRERWSRMVDSNQLDPEGAGSGVRRSPHLITIAVLVFLLAATILGAVV